MFYDLIIIPIVLVLLRLNIRKLFPIENRRDKAFVVLLISAIIIQLFTLVMDALIIMDAGKLGRGLFLTIYLIGILVLSPVAIFLFFYSLSQIRKLGEKIGVLERLRTLLVSMKILYIVQLVLYPINVFMMMWGLS